MKFLETGKHLFSSVKKSVTRIAGASSTKVTSYCDGYNLVPANQLVLKGQTGSTWVSEGTDPGFWIRANSGQAVNAGWHCVFIHIEGDGTFHSAKLYADFGHGCTEEDAHRIAYKPGQPVMQIVHFYQSPNSVRFDPLEVEGEFEVISFQLSPLSVSSATEVMLNTLNSISNVRSGGASNAQTLREELMMKASKDDVAFSSYVYETYRRQVSPAPSYGASGASYQSWIDHVEKPSLHSDVQIKNNLSAWKLVPKISVLMPVYNTNERYLRECINSVINQSYTNWELCIADDKSSLEHVKKVLEEYEAADSRIKVVYREVNGHISHATNSALAIADGEFVAFIDHDDTIAKDALYHFAEAINDKPQTKFLYSDEDWTDAPGNRVRPHFKSDWNPDLLYSHNYITHMCVFNKALIDSVDGIRVGVEGSQDYDLLLRCIDKLKREEISHIPRVLYHWRAIEGSTALSAGEKSYSDDAGLTALQDHIQVQSSGLAEVTCSDLPNIYKVTWPVPSPEPLVSLLMPTRDQKAVTEIAIRSILEVSNYQNFELIVLDNGSEKAETLEFFEQIQKEDARVKVLRYDHPFNYPAINNFGVEKSSGEFICLINNDIEVISPNWLNELVGHASRPDIGCVGAKLYYENDTVQHGGVIMGIGGVAGHSHRGCPRSESGYVARLFVVQNLSGVTAACLVVRRSVYEEAGGLDAKNLPIAFNDVDFCLKVRELGYRNLWTPYAELYHYESVSRGYEDTPEKLARFDKESEFMKQKWGDILTSDPYYSPNLTLSREDFSLDVGMSS